jgi:hypothetical protein
MRGKQVKPPGTKNRPVAVGFVTQALETHRLQVQLKTIAKREASLLSSSRVVDITNYLSPSKQTLTIEIDRIILKG